MLKLQAIGMSDTWAIRWYASVFLNNGFCLHPRKSLVNNIGHVDSRMHCACKDVYDVNVSEDKDFIFAMDICMSKKAVIFMADLYQLIRNTSYVLAYNKIKQVIK